MDQKNFKEYVNSLDLSEEMKADIINKHVEEEKEIVERTNGLIAKEKGLRDMSDYALRTMNERYQNVLENNQDILRMTKGALEAVRAMILYNGGGTHRMRDFYEHAIASYINGVEEGLDKHLAIDNQELPF